MKTWIFCLSILLALCSGVAKADTLDDAKAAYDKGDYAEAIGLWRPMAEKGNAVAQYNLGNMYYQGRGVARNFREAAAWWRLAAVEGDADAQFNLGTMYQQGRGVAQDYQQAMMWYQRAAARGDPQAQDRLRALHEKGQGGQSLLVQPAPASLVAPPKQQSVFEELGLPDPDKSPINTPDVNTAQSGIASKRGSKTAMWAIVCAVLGAIVGLFASARAFIRKIKGQDKDASTLTRAVGDTPIPARDVNKSNIYKKAKMRKTTKLRLIGVAVLLFILWLIGNYNIEGIPVLLLTFGFAAGYEYLVVRPVSKALDKSESE